jgi:hypothetical protein
MRARCCDDEEEEEEEEEEEDRWGATQLFRLAAPVKATVRGEDIVDGREESGRKASPPIHGATPTANHT